MKIGEIIDEEKPRHSEFGGEEERWEFYDWDRKMEEYRRELKEEELARKMKREKSRKTREGMGADENLQKIYRGKQFSMER